MYEKKIETFSNQALFKLGNCLFQLSRLQEVFSPLESALLLEKATRAYMRAHEIKPDDYEIIFNCANAIYHKANMVSTRQQFAMGKTEEAKQRQGKFINYVY